MQAMMTIKKQIRLTAASLILLSNVAMAQTGFDPSACANYLPPNFPTESSFITEVSNPVNAMMIAPLLDACINQNACASNNATSGTPPLNGMEDCAAVLANRANISGIYATLAYLPGGSSAPGGGVSSPTPPAKSPVGSPTPSANTQKYVAPVINNPPSNNSNKSNDIKWF